MRLGPCFLGPDVLLGKLQLSAAYPSRSHPEDSTPGRLVLSDVRLAVVAAPAQSIHSSQRLFEDSVASHRGEGLD